MSIPAKDIGMEFFGFMAGKSYMGITSRTMPSLDLARIDVFETIECYQTQFGVIRPSASSNRLSSTGE